MSTAIEKKPNGSEQFALTAPTFTPTPLDLLQAAVKQGVSVEILKGLQELYERSEANNARKAFVEAMNSFKKNPPTIAKTKPVTLSRDAGAQPAYFYAPLNQVCAAIVPALNAVGITHNWETANDGDKIVVTCVLRHELGHVERASTLKAAPDTGPGRNAIQSLGSTVTYLQRYTLLASCGLATTMDDDVAASESGLADERYVQLLTNIEGSNNMDELKRYYFAANKEAADANDQKAQKAFANAKNKRYKELANVSR